MAPDQIIPIIGAGTMLALSFAVASRAVTPGLWMLVLSQVTTRIFTRSLQTAAIASVSIAPRDHVLPALQAAGVLT